MAHQYVYGVSRASHKPHNMPADEIRRLFIAVGWIGERKTKPILLRAVPFFDTGPGPDIGR